MAGGQQLEKQAYVRHAFGFNHKNPGKAMDEFKGHLSEGNKWFVQFVEQIQEINHRPRKITDILIRENEEIRIMRPFPPEIIQVKDSKDQLFKPSGDHINNLVKKLHIQDTKYLESMSSIDFAIAIYGVGVFRMNYSSHEMGCELSIRYLDFDILEFDGLPCPSYYKRWFKDLVMKRTMKDKDGRELDLGYVNSGGLILHIGPTGSGKTTQLSSELAFIAANTDVPILTYEKPIEYRHTATKAPVSQYELGRDIREQDGVSEFDVMKANLLRKSPSVVMIAEVKSEHEIYELVDIANRGHLVFSTLHAQNILEAITVIMSVMGSSRSMLAGSLKAIVAHYLYTARDNGKIVPLYEILLPNPVVRKLIYDGPEKLPKIKSMFYQERALKGSGSVTFSQYIDDLVKEGIITDEDRGDVRKSMMFDIVEVSEDEGKGK